MISQPYHLKCLQNSATFELGQNLYSGGHWAGHEVVANEVANVPSNS